MPVKFAALISEQTLHHELSAAFELESGETLSGVVIAYRTWGATVCANILGSCYGTTGPLSRAPDQASGDGERYRANFPAIRSDPEWCNGFYADDAGPTAGLAAARMMAVCTFRSWQSFEERFGRAKNGEVFEVQSYLRYQGHKMNQRFDANTYITLTQAMHTHDLARGRGEYAEVLSGLTQATTGLRLVKPGAE